MSRTIKVGIIGLSASKNLRGTSWASLAHLPYLLKSPRYEIVAVQNTSEESAKKAIEQFELPGIVKAYGTAEGI